MSRVRQYYDRNTRKFLFFGSQKAIHREIWGPTVGSVEDAVHWVHGELAAVFPEADRLLDLGCGVGTSCFYFAEALGAETMGVSISELQIKLARKASARLGLDEQCQFRSADFETLPKDLGTFDAAYAIESFIHADDPAAFFASARRHLVRGGTLVIVDDFLVGSDYGSSLIDDIREGWHAQTLINVHEMESLAVEHGFTVVENRDLTKYLRLGRPRDRLVELCQPLFRAFRNRSPWFQSLVGGDALQRALGDGALEHRFVVLCSR